MIKLNLGCGRDYKEEWINVDRHKEKDIQGRRIITDKSMDLNVLPYDFPDNYADEIIIDNVLEHLDKPMEVMKELKRILRPMGYLKVIVPHYSSWAGYTDPTHKTYYGIQMGSRNNFNNGLVLTKESLNVSSNKWLKFLNYIANLNPRLYERLCFGIFNPQEIIWEYKKNV